MATTLNIRLTGGQAQSLRELVNDKEDALFLKLARAEKDYESTTARIEGLRGALGYWNEIDVAIRDAGPSPVADLTAEQRAAPELLAALIQNHDEARAWVKSDSVAELRQTLRNIMEISQAAIAKAKP
jgi:hypothetical protein